MPDAPTWVDTYAHKLHEMRDLRQGWAGPGCEAPSALAVDLVQSVLNGLRDECLRPASLNPSVVGGIGVTVLNELNGHEVYIEVYNDGEILMLVTKPDEDPMIRPLHGDEISDPALFKEIRVHTGLIGSE